MKKYLAVRDVEGCTAFVIDEGKSYEFPHVELHSPDGFEFGYAGSGPADLALSILADYFGEKPTKEQLRAGWLHETPCKCVLLHQAFKSAFIAVGTVRQSLQIVETQIAFWLELPGVKSTLEEAGVSIDGEGEGR